MPRKSVAVFSPHAQVLVQIGRNPDIRMREIAGALDMTERNVQNLMRDLQDAGVVRVERRGRRNRYRLKTRRRVGQELGASMTVGQLLRLALGSKRGEAAAAESAPEEPESPGRGNASERAGAPPSPEPAPAPTEPEDPRRRPAEPESETRRQVDWLKDL